MLCPRYFLDGVIETGPEAVSGFRMRTRAKSQFALDHLRFINLAFAHGLFPRFVDQFLNNRKSSNCYQPCFGRNHLKLDLVTHLNGLAKSLNKLMRAEMEDTTIEKSPVDLVPIAKDKRNRLVLHLAHVQT